VAEVNGLELAFFLAFVVFATWLDLFVLHKDDHDIGLAEAAWTSLAWVVVALLFSGYVFWKYGAQGWAEYLTGYTLEKALSVDNIFVIAMIFNFFRVRGGLQHRALAWGVLGAVVMRGIMIYIGTSMVERFSWILPLFGLFLLYSGVKMLKGDHKEDGLEQNRVYRWITRNLPVYPGFVKNHIITRQNGRLMLTTLGLAIVMVEATDLIFAIDSIPAVMAVSQNFFVVLTSNIFAILGLRALYFLLAGVIHRFRYLKVGLSVVLAFIGGKLLVLPLGIHVNHWVSLGVVLSVVAVSILASLIIPDTSSTRSEQLGD